MLLNSYIDHTLLKPTALISDIMQLCTEAAAYSFAAVCVPPPLVGNARKELINTSVRTATVIGFPFGYANAAAKKAEAIQAMKDGADELDMVINIIALKNKAWNYVQSEISALTTLAHEQQKLIKVIIESGVLSDEEIIRCCEICATAGVDFVKTSTGYAEKGASVEAVKLMRAHLPTNVRIKASGGIRTYDFAHELVLAGAERLGCSASVAIVEGSGKTGDGY
ncbi:MAG: deoxyribose-phosphate aldolase [Chitinophagaceae bacterium]|nr:MAG: deoxyribose-phosphate aldolase [Chitinophagaceae bacterium]